MNAHGSCPGDRRHEIAPGSRRVHHYRGLEFVAKAIDDSPVVSDAFHRGDCSRGVDLTASGAQPSRVAPVQRSDVDLTCAGFEQAGGNPVGSDDFCRCDNLVCTQYAHVGHEFDHSRVHRVHVFDVAMRSHPDQWERLQQRLSESLGRILHERPAGRGEQSNRAPAVAFEECCDGAPGRVVGEGCLHLEQTDRAIRGQLIANRHARDATSDHQHVVRLHLRSLSLRSHDGIHRQGFFAAGPVSPVEFGPQVLLASA